MARRWCSRPQCRAIYNDSKSLYCFCGALLLSYNPAHQNGTGSSVDNQNPTNDEDLAEIEPELKASSVVTEDDSSGFDFFNDSAELTSGENLASDDTIAASTGISSENPNNNNNGATAIEQEKSLSESTDVENIKGGEGHSKKGYIYLLLDDNEIEYPLSDTTRIGRTTEESSVDIDLTEYAGTDISRQHIIITRENGKYFISNISKTHSVRIIDANNNEYAMEYGEKRPLKSEDGILLSKKILLQFVEEE